MKKKNVREAVGVFHDEDTLNEALGDLETSGFGREAFSILGTRQAIEEKFGRLKVKPEMVEDNPNAPRQAPVRPEEKVVGTSAMVGGGAYLGAVGALLVAGVAAPIPTAITGAVVGAGGGGVLARFFDKQVNEPLDRQIEAGGVVLWVRTANQAEEKYAVHILKDHGAEDVHIHEIAQNQ